MTEATITSVSREDRVFAPPAELAATASIGSLEAYEAMYRRSIDDPEGFWREQAAAFHFYEPPRTILEGALPAVRWFAGGTTNMAVNCLDRHLDGATAQKAAIVWEGEPGEVRTLTYRQLAYEVGRLANALASMGVGAGDRVGVYMGLVPEAAIAMLACARIGAVHTVVFGGFAADAVRDRLNDAGAKVVITQDAAYRRGQLVPLKAQVDRALASCPSVERVVVLRRASSSVDMHPERDVDYHELVARFSGKHEPARLDAEHPLFILYTSGTTGKPKGVLHTTAGYMVGVGLTTRHAFDLRADDVYWCTADVGWVTGHSYSVYGPLLNGATTLLYEGAPNFPDEGRFWSMIERHGVSIFYTAPTAIRAFVKWGEAWPRRYDLGSLRILGSVGEPINPEAFMWYRHVIGGDRCPVIDTWWQTETGAIMMSPLPGAIAAKPGSCALPFFGVSPKILREDGSEADANEGGYLVLDRPWPSMMRTIWGDDARFAKTYFSQFPGVYFTGDGARRDEDGYFWVMGRVDDVVNVAGHRLGTAELESALVAHEAVAEAAVVGRPDALKGQALVAFVTLKGDRAPSAALRDALLEHVATEIGKFARPDTVRFAGALPKTRSGKIMRRLLKELATTNEIHGDVTTLEDMSVLAALRQDEE
jgi:acetyl-CoA synthetase